MNMKTITYRGKKILKEQGPTPLIYTMNIKTETLKFATYTYGSQKEQQIFSLSVLNM